MAISNTCLAIQTVEQRSWLKEVALILGASVLIALFAPISIPLYFTPVPLATQSLIVLLMGACLGSKRGALAVLTFLLQGAMGLPVFASGKCGLLCLAGPSGGYLLGYVAAAFITGWILENTSRRTTARTFLAMSAGSLTIYVFGAAWLSKFTGMPAALTLGVLPFLIGDFLKVVVGVKLLKKLRLLNA